MAKHTRHKPLIIVTPHDLGPPIYYSPQEDAVLLFSQILSAILLGVRELDEEQISVGLESLKMFFNEYQDRHMLYYGGGALLVIGSTVVLVSNGGYPESKDATQENEDSP